MRWLTPFRSALLQGTLAMLLASAASSQAREISIPGGDLKSALDTYARQSGVQLVYREDDIRGLRTEGASGAFSVMDALARILAGTSLIAQQDSSGAIAIVRNEATSVENSSSPVTGTGDAILEIVVTGSHIRGTEPAGANVQRISREEIESSGYGRLQDVIATMTQAFKGATEEFTQSNGNVNFGADIQLRGLGPGTTLTLVNGLRQPSGGSRGAFTDITGIPVAAIERVEILSDGASAIYGSDAIGGVANIVLRDDFQGAETRVRMSDARGGADEVQLSQVFGLRWGGGHTVFGYEFYQRDPLAYTEREYTARNGDMRAYGGTDFRQQQRRYQSAPGNILCPTGRTDCVAGTPVFAIPAGQDGVGLTPDDLIASAVNYTDIAASSDVLPWQRMHGFFVTASQDITTQWTLNGLARFSDRDTARDSDARTITVDVPSTNPFYVDAFGNGRPVRVAYDLANDLGPARSTSETRTSGVALSAVGRFGGGWGLNITTSYGKDDNRAVTDYVDQTNAATAAALTVALADTNPATALNVFGGGGNNNPAVVNQFRNTFVAGATSEVWSAGAIADGPMFNMPAGAARLALGVDYRDEKLEVLSSGRMVPTDRQVSAGFAELALPLAGPSSSWPGVHQLDLSFAGRFEHYSDFGDTFNPKIGLTYAPVSTVAIRGTWGTSFRAPPFFLSSTDLAGTTAGVTTVRDPASTSPTGTTTVLRVFGNNPNLTEETAEVWTAGLDISPIEDLRISATFFDIQYQDKIQSNSVSLVQEAQYASLITRNPTQAQIDAFCANPDVLVTGGGCSGPIGAILDFRVQNIAELDVSGIDLDVQYGLQSAIGKWSYRIGGTYNLKYEQAVTPTAPPVDNLDNVGNPLDLRLRGSVSWSLREWSAAASVSYFDAYTNRTVLPIRKVDSYTTVDLNIGFQPDGAHGTWLSGMRFSLSAVNLFDEMPPFVNQFDGYDGAHSSVLGRLVSVQLVKVF